MHQPQSPGQSLQVSPASQTWSPQVALAQGPHSPGQAEQLSPPSQMLSPHTECRGHSPQSGWQGWSEGTRVQFDGTGWVQGAGALSANGAGFVHRTIEVDHAVQAGATSLVIGAIPENTIVYGVTGRVLSGIGGATGLEIGVAGATDRYGSGIGTTSGAWLRGLTGSPLTYYASTDLILTALGGGFDGTGALRVAVHFAELTLPRA